jgi:hypothetical protein
VRRKNRIVAGAALAAALAAGCRPAAPDTSGVAPGVSLAAPTPSSATVASPLGVETTDYTNEMQAQTLRDEAIKMGITKFGRPSNQGSETEEVRAPLTYQEGLNQTRQLARDLEAQRHVIDKDKNKTVALPSTTPSILPGRKEGSPIESAPDEAGPKDPEIK